MLTERVINVMSRLDQWGGLALSVLNYPTGSEHAGIHSDLLINK